MLSNGANSMGRGAVELYRSRTRGAVRRVEHQQDGGGGTGNREIQPGSAATE